MANRPPTPIDLISVQMKDNNDDTRPVFRYPKDLSSKRFCLLELSDINRLY